MPWGGPEGQPPSVSLSRSCPSPLSRFSHPNTPAPLPTPRTTNSEGRCVRQVEHGPLLHGTHKQANKGRPWVRTRRPPQTQESYLTSTAPPVGIKLIFGSYYGDQLKVTITCSQGCKWLISRETQAEQTEEGHSSSHPHWAARGWRWCPREAKGPGPAIGAPQLFQPGSVELRRPNVTLFEPKKGP